MPDPNDRPTASEIRDIASHGGIIDPDDLRGLIRDLAAAVAGQQPSAIVNDINQRLLSLGKRIAALEAPGCEERLKAGTFADVAGTFAEDDYGRREKAHDSALRAEGAAAERERIRKIAEGLQSKRVATASGDYNDGRYNAYLDIISSTQPEVEKAEEENDWLRGYKNGRDDERLQILEMLGPDGEYKFQSPTGFEFTAIERDPYVTLVKIFDLIRAAIRARGTK